MPQTHRSRRDRGSFLWKDRSCQRKECLYSPACLQLPLVTGQDSLPEKLQGTMKLIRDYHHLPKLDIHLVSGKVGLSPRRIQQLFQSHLHQCFTHYLNQVRLDHLNRLKAEYPELYIKELIAKAGFKSRHDYYHSLK